MSLAVEEMPPSCLLREGEASADEQLRLAGQLGKALLEENEELRREIRRLRDTIADSHQVRYALPLWTDQRVCWSLHALGSGCNGWPRRTALR